MTSEGAEPPTQPCIALITDFGLDAWYAGVLHGVIANGCPEARVIDVTHSVAPQSIIEAGIALAASLPHFPAHTIFVVVVDPGVGTAREAVVVRLGGHWFVGPNNGVFGLVGAAPGAECRVIRADLLAPAGCSPTFHGRDVFAPAAAAIACEGSWDRICGSATDVVAFPASQPEMRGGVVTGEILMFDRFGNAITSIRAEHMAGMGAADAAVTCGKFTATPIRRTYGEVPAGDPLAYWGSAGFLELGVNMENARSRFDLAARNSVTVSARGKA